VSDERDTRDGGESEGSTSGNADLNAADATDEADASVVRPSGKRSTRRSRAGSEVTTATKVASVRGSTRTATKAAPRSEKPKENPFKALRRFLREVVAELRKVIWPNRKQMITYTSVVLVFVVFMVAFISGLDLAFIKGVSWLFG